ncbi:hypothetical protein M8C21_001706, partial [Ambrosia artemisiifolia]
MPRGFIREFEDKCGTPIGKLRQVADAMTVEMHARLASDGGHQDLGMHCALSLCDFDFVKKKFGFFKLFCGQIGHTRQLRLLVGLKLNCFHFCTRNKEGGSAGLTRLIINPGVFFMLQACDKPPPCCRPFPHNFFSGDGLYSLVGVSNGAIHTNDTKLPWHRKNHIEMSDAATAKRHVSLQIQQKVITTSAADGLPPGWIKEVRTKIYATDKRSDPFYTDPLTGYIFRSKMDAMRFLDTGNVNLCAIRPKVKDRDGKEV